MHTSRITVNRYLALEKGGWKNVTWRKEERKRLWDKEWNVDLGRIVIYQRGP